MNLASAARILKAQPSDKILMVAENAQYWREVVEAKRLIDSGALGEVLAVRAKFWESADPALCGWLPMAPITRAASSVRPLRAMSSMVGYTGSDRCACSLRRL